MAMPVPRVLPRKAGGRAAHAQRYLAASGYLSGRSQVVDRARDQHGVGQHAVDRGVGRVQPARQRARADLAGHVAGELGGRGKTAFAGSWDAGFGRSSRSSIDARARAALPGAPRARRTVPR